MIEARIESDNDRIREINEDCARKRAARQTAGGGGEQVALQDCEADDEQGSQHGEEVQDDGEANSVEEREGGEC